jgi:hypothetical protein
MPEFKVISFAGVIECSGADCRLLNLSVMYKKLDEDCENAEQSVSYKDVAKDYYHRFNIMKTAEKNNIKRIAAIKLYPGS